jgi:uncharacterized membrane protein
MLHPRRVTARHPEAREISIMTTGEGPRQSPFVFSPIDAAESELPPRRLLVFAFENDAHAHAALGDVKQLVARGKLKVEDACVVVRREDKMLDITETADMGGLGGAMRGGLAGAAVGVLALVPVAGLVVGAAVGGFLARHHDYGIDRDFQQRVGEALKPGSAALVTVVESADIDAALEAVSGWNAEIVATDLDEAVADRLREVLAAGSTR